MGLWSWRARPGSENSYIIEVFVIGVNLLNEVGAVYETVGEVVCIDVGVVAPPPPKSEISESPLPPLRRARRL